LKTIVVGIGDCKWTRSPDISLTAYALGSCVALAVYDPIVRIGGLLHLMLPGRRPEIASDGSNLFMFAESGVPILIDETLRLGAHKQRLLIGIAGGAKIMDQSSMFEIGSRNLAMVESILRARNLATTGRSVGGEVPRTAGLDIGKGRFWVLENGTKKVDLFPLFGEAAAQHTPSARL
jgi:chemotaxis protein CheD